MSLFIPGQHSLVHAKILDFDAATQAGHVQFIGMYGLTDTGKPDPQPVGNDTLWITRAREAMQKSYLPQATYQPGDWVGVLGVPKGPTGIEYTDNLLGGVIYTEFKTAYWIIGKLAYTPPEENLDHNYAARMGNAPMGFPPIVYPPLPSETEGDTGSETQV